MEEPFCPICSVEYDENGVCAIDCMALVTFEDDQARAEAYEIMDSTPPSELTQRDKDMITLVLYKARLRRG